MMASSHVNNFHVPNHAEAYALIPKKANYGEEAIVALLDNMTKDEFKGNLLVILGGYEDDIEKIFALNAGLRSRFDKMRIAFRAWTSQDAFECTLRCITEDNKAMTDDACALMLKTYELMCTLSGWSSARDVKETVLPALYMARAVRLRDTSRVAEGDSTCSGGEKTAAQGLPSTSSRGGDVIGARLMSPYEVADVIEVFERHIQHRCNGNTRDMFRRFYMMT